MDSGIYREGMKVELTLDCRHFADRFSAKWILVLPIAPLWRSSMYVRIHLPQLVTFHSQYTSVVFCSLPRWWAVAMG